MLPFKYIYLPSKQALFSQTARKPKKWTSHFMLSSHQVFHGSSSAEFASEKPHSIYEASLRVQHSCCNIFLTGNNLQQYFEGISDQVYPSKQDPQELWTKSYCLVHQAMPLLKFKGKEISPNSSEHQEALFFCLFVFS